MRIRQKVDGEVVDVELRVKGNDVEYRVLHEGSEAPPFAQASFIEAEPGVYSVIAGTRSFDFRLEHAHYGIIAQHRSTRVLLEVAKRGRAKAVGTASGSAPVKAAMPGRVVRVLVSEGEAVEAGQGLVVLEAMKMQNEISANRGGIVRRLSAVEGATVTAGAVLCLLE